ncbi:MAG: glutamate ABC transporter substrate-binding protein [Actinobacteria bacterium]|nr:glutamate ABC transporter substrate-binding protein [Actinomycetota bacterium]
MRALRITTLAAAAALTLAACGGGSDGGDDTAAPSTSESPAAFADGTRMKELADAGKITVGTKFDQPLFGLKGLSGEPEGFDVEVAQLIAAKLGIPEDGIEYVETVSSNREPFLEQKQVDIVVATYTINDKRDEVVDFAGPYFVAGQDILVKADNPEGIEGPDGLAGKTVCSVSGSTPAGNIQQNYPEAKLVLFDTYTKCRDALRDGTDGVVAVTTDNVILSGYVSESPDDFELVGKTFRDEPYGIGLPEGQEEFCQFINEVLQEADEDGTLQKAFDDTAGKFIESELELPEPRGCDS